jgi:hypothetical protein
MASSIQESAAASLPDIPVLRYNVQDLDLEQYMISADSFWMMDTIRHLLQDILKTANKDIRNYHKNYLKVVEFKPTSIRQALRHVAYRYRHYTTPPQEARHPAGHASYSRTANMYYSDRPPLPRTTPFHDGDIEGFQIPEVIVHWGASAKLYRNVSIAYYNPSCGMTHPFMPMYDFNPNAGVLIEGENTFLDTTASQAVIHTLDV